MRVGTSLWSGLVGAALALVTTVGIAAAATPVARTFSGSTAAACNFFDDACRVTFTSAEGDVIDLTLALVDFSGDNFCLPLQPGGTLRTASGRFDFGGGSLCVTQTNTSGEPGGSFVGTFTIVDGSGAYADALGSGTFHGRFSGSLDFELRFESFSADPLSLPGDTGSGDPGGPGPDPGATPELSSLALVATALSGAGGYALLRRRARR